MPADAAHAPLASNAAGNVLKLEVWQTLPSVLLSLASLTPNPRSVLHAGRR